MTERLRTDGLAGLNPLEVGAVTPSPVRSASMSGDRYQGIGLGTSRKPHRPSRAETCPISTSAASLGSQRGDLQMNATWTSRARRPGLTGSHRCHHHSAAARRSEESR